MSSPSSSTSDSDASSSSLHASLKQAITGLESPPSSLMSGSSSKQGDGGEDDWTPFPSPQMASMKLDNDDAISEAEFETLSDTSSEGGIDESYEPTEEDKREADSLKSQGNTAFVSQDYPAAITFFTRAIRLNPHVSVYWGNRAMARMKLEEYGGAVLDCTKAIELDESNVKAYYRRALSKLAILRPTQAVADFKTVLRLDPRNALAKEQLASTVKLIRRIEFEKAISVGETETASAKVRKMVSEGSVPLDNDYKGPLPAWDEQAKSYKPTVEWVGELMEHFKNGGKVPKRLCWEIVLGCKEQLDKEASLVEVDVPKGVKCDIVGDTHGQFYDLCNLLSMIGSPSDSHMIVFNGDFVDRGSWSVEVALSLFAYKWACPDRIFLNRGNHETSDMNKVYGFEGECKAKHGEMTYKLFADVFTSLPMATLLSASQAPSSKQSEGSQPAILSPQGRKRYFVVHGGLFSKDGVTLDDVKKIDRYGKQPGQEGLMCELLWTDPQEFPGRGPSKRGVGVGFGPDVTKRWCDANGVTAVIRSHEVRAEGYAVEHDGLCITVFSCPNYCDSTGNKAAYIRMSDDGQLAYSQFNAVPHPDVRPMAYSSGFGGL